MIVFESTLFILAVSRSIQFAFGGGTTPHLMFILIRDSVMYFGGILAVVLTNCIVWAVGRVRHDKLFKRPSKLTSTHSEHCVQHLTGVPIYCIHDVRASTLLSSILPIVTTVVQNIHWDPINPHLQDVG